MRCSVSWRSSRAKRRNNFARGRKTGLESSMPPDDCPAAFSCRRGAFSVALSRGGSGEFFRWVVRGRAAIGCKVRGFFAPEGQRVRWLFRGVARAVFRVGGIRSDAPSVIGAGGPPCCGCNENRPFGYFRKGDSRKVRSGRKCPLRSVSERLFAYAADGVAFGAVGRV